jgi:hypothetical protein
MASRIVTCTIHKACFRSSIGPMQMVPTMETKGPLQMVHPDNENHTDNKGLDMTTYQPKFEPDTIWMRRTRAWYRCRSDNELEQLLVDAPHQWPPQREALILAEIARRQEKQHRAATKTAEVRP